MKKIIFTLFAGVLLFAAAETNFAQEQPVLAKSFKKESEKTETKNEPEDKEKSAPAQQTNSDAKCESCRWFEPTIATFSFRYRTLTNADNVRTFNQGQQRIVLGGKLKLDKEGRYTINAQASSGYYFNWAYADTGWGNTANEARRRGAAGQAVHIAEELVPGFVQTRVTNYIAQNYPNATPEQIAQLRTTLTAQFTPAMMASYTASYERTLRGINTRVKGWNLFVRQLYVKAEPINGLEFSYGSLPINKGVNSEATSYDDDGYVSGGRISVKRPKQLWFDEMSVTYAYLGDIFTPNFFRRTERFKKSNYHQFLLRKKLFNGRVDASVDYTFQDGSDTMREAVSLNVKESKIIDTLRVEAYQRIGDNVLTDSFSGKRTFEAGSGFYVQGEKTIAKKLTLTGGYANIDRGYSIYGHYSIPSLYYHGFAMNGDQVGLGQRLISKANYKLTDDLGISMLYTHAFGNDPQEMRYFWNKTHLNFAITYDILRGVKKHFGWFK
jgi:hypothetical protein